MTYPLLQSFPLLIHIRLNLFDLLLLQVSISSLFQEVLPDGEAARLMVDRISPSIFYLIKRKDIRLNREDG